MTQSNFQALLRDKKGRVVPGSIRRGHNVFTTVGREVLTQLVGWSSLGTGDTPFTKQRIRWFEVGSGVQPEIKDVVGVLSPLEVEGVFGTFMKAIDPTLITFPTVTSVKFKLVFGPDELSHGGPVLVSEAALISDVDSGAGPGLDPGDGNNPVSYYKTFEGLVKMPSFSFEMDWELRF